MPHIKIANLASHVLSKSLKQLKKEWLERYGIEPVVVETFVEKGRYLGTCYRAANFKHVGMTQGRGRQDRRNEYGLPVKEIYLYPLSRDIHQLLCEGQTQEVMAMKGCTDWAVFRAM